MSVRVGRTVVAAVGAELGTYVVWVVVLIVGGLIIMNPSRTKWFAYFFGQSVGILSGFLLCVFAARWAARASDDPVKSGVIVGVMCAALNAVIVGATTAKFPPILLIGSLGRVLGGSVGGWFAQRTSRPNNALQATREDARA